MKEIISVDFKINAEGFGIVNWQGATSLRVDGQTVDNITLPKLRGFTNQKTIRKDDGTTFEGTINAHEIDPKKTPAYVSSNCIFHHLFKNEAALYPHNLAHKDSHTLLFSLLGLVRGYMVTGEKAATGKAPQSAGKKRSLFCSDFTELLGQGNLEQLNKFGPKEGDFGKSSFFSKFTFGKTRYEGFMSLNIEDLRFIYLDSNYGKNACGSSLVDDTLGKEIAEGILTMLKELNTNSKLKPTATFNKFARITEYDKEGVPVLGVYLNDDALEIIIELMKKRISELTIKQGGGTFYVSSVLIDYNTTSRPRILESDTSCNNTREDMSYVPYFKKVSK